MHAQLFSLARPRVEIDGEKCPIKREATWCLKTRRKIDILKKGAILTSPGRGSLVFGWTWALECSLSECYWWLHGSSISPPDWLVLLWRNGNSLWNGLGLFLQLCHRQVYITKQWLNNILFFIIFCRGKHPILVRVCIDSDMIQATVDSSLSLSRRLSVALRAELNHFIVIELVVTEILLTIIKTPGA